MRKAFKRFSASHQRTKSSDGVDVYSKEEYRDSHSASSSRTNSIRHSIAVARRGSGEKSGTDGSQRLSLGQPFSPKGPEGPIGYNQRRSQGGATADGGHIRKDAGPSRVASGAGKVALPASTDRATSSKQMSPGPRLPDVDQTSETLLSAVMRAAPEPEPDHGNQAANGGVLRRAPASLKNISSDREIGGTDMSDKAAPKVVAFAPSPKKIVRKPASDQSHTGGVRDDARGQVRIPPRGSSSSADVVVARSLTPQKTSPAPSRANSAGAAAHSKRSLVSGRQRTLSSEHVISGHRPTSLSMSTEAKSTMHDYNLRPTKDPRAANSVPFATTRSDSPQSFDARQSHHSFGLQGPEWGARASLPSRFGSMESLLQGSSLGSGKETLVPTWSEMTQEDLVANIGARERTRQEVLWEIVASEERYAHALQKMKEIYIDSLLVGESDSSPNSKQRTDLTTHAASNPWSSTGSTSEKVRPRDRTRDDERRRSSVSEAGGLPIAQKFSDVSFDARAPSSLTPSISERATLRELPPDQSNRSQGHGILIKRPSDDVGRSSRTADKSHSDDVQHIKKAGSIRSLANDDRTVASKGDGHSSRMTKTKFASARESLNLTPTLKIVLQSLDGGILQGHAQLLAALRQRYEQQWPLVRGLADIFTGYSYVLHLYRDYVVHLERALDVVDESALMERAMRGKRLRKDRISPTIALGRKVAELEAKAAEEGEAGLSIFLTMPFQRLLKYPLLFQNLLFHTDASTIEFESTIQMVVDVEKIVRAIEDEKMDREERDKVIDAFARIEGIDDRRLLRPRNDRTLVEESPIFKDPPRRTLSESSGGSEDSLPSHALSTSSGFAGRGASLSGYRSHRTLGDIWHSSTSKSCTSSANPASPLQPSAKAPRLGSKKDLWDIRFSDVQIRCQRIGLTALPLVSSTFGMTSTAGGDEVTTSSLAMNDEEIKKRSDFKLTREGKERQRAFKNHTLRSKPRNLYKFVAVTSWSTIRETAKEPASNDDYDVIMEGEDGDEDNDSELEDEDHRSSDEYRSAAEETEMSPRRTKLSFSYLGNDRIEPRLSDSRARSRVSVRSAQSLLSSGVAAGLHSGAVLSSSDLHDSYNHSKSSPLKRSSLALSPVPRVRPSFDSPQVPGRVSRAVAATNTKLRAEKFGHRLRDNTRPPPPSSTRADMELLGSHAELDEATLPSQEEPVLAPARSTRISETMSSTTVPSRRHSALALAVPGQRSVTRYPSFVRDRSFDSSLRLMGSLVQPGPGVEADD